jgi:hypothetical protein
VDRASSRHDGAPSGQIKLPLLGRDFADSRGDGMRAPERRRLGGARQRPTPVASGPDGCLRASSSGWHAGRAGLSSCRGSRAEEPADRRDQAVMRSGQHEPALTGYGEHDVGLRPRRRAPLELASVLDYGLAPDQPLRDSRRLRWADPAPRQELLEVLDTVDNAGYAAPRVARDRLTLHAPVLAGRGRRCTRLRSRRSRAKECSGRRPPRATISWSICARPNATAHLRRCTVTTRSKRDPFHWESQSTQTAAQPAVSTTSSAARGSTVLLFGRERTNFELGTQPFAFLGLVRYVEYRGERPVAFRWRRPVPMRAELFEIARGVAAA